MGATAGTARACGCSKDQEVDVEVTSVPPALPAPGPNADNDLQAHAQVDLGGAAAVPGPQKGRRRSLLLRDALVPDLDILRGVSVKDTLSGFGRLWRYSPMDLSEELRLAMWDRSRQMESFDLFLSHTWRTRGLWKFLALTLQCGWQRLLLSWFLALILAETLAFFDILPFHMNFTVPRQKCAGSGLAAFPWRTSGLRERLPRHVCPFVVSGVSVGSHGFGS